MKPLAIIGTGGLAKEIYAAIRAINAQGKRHDILGFVDTESTGQEIINGLKVICTEEALLNYDTPLDLVIALGSPAKRKSVSARLLQNRHFSFPSIIHPSAIMDSDSTRVGMGCYIAAGAVLSPGAVLNDFVMVNILASIAHDVQAGAYSVINPHANVSGKVILGESVLVGASAVVHQGLTLEAGSSVGMGSVLTRNTMAGAAYFGNPARKIMESE